MRPILAASVVIGFLASSIGAQDIPPRFQSLSKDGKLRVTRILGTPELHPSLASTSAFSADGMRAIHVEDLSTGADDKPAFRARLIVWDGAGFPREIDIEGRNVTALDLAPDGKTVLLAGLILPDKAKETETYLAVWDLDKGKELHSFRATERLILNVALSPEGKAALTGSPENLMRWDLETRKATKLYGEKDKSNVTALAYLKGGKQFLAGYYGGEVRLHDIDKEKHVQAYRHKGPHQFIWHLAPSPDGKRFAAADLHAFVSLWETNTGKEIGTHRPEKPSGDELITSLALAPDGKTVLALWAKPNAEPDDFANGKLVAWDAETNKLKWSKVVGFRGRVPVHIQGDTLQIGGGPNWLETWSIKHGERAKSVGGHRGTVNAVGVLENGDILSVGQEGLIMTWRKGEIVQKQQAHKGAITAMTVLSNRLYVTAGADLAIHGWPPDASRPPTFRKKHGGTITSLALSSTGRWAASASADRTIKTWFVPTGDERATLSGHAEGVNAVAISPDDAWIASASDDTTIRLWPIKQGQLDKDRDPVTLEKHKKPVMCLAFSSDGKRLYSGGQDHTIMAWDLARGKMDFMIPGHKNWITSILLLDDKTLVSTSDDLTVCAWDLATGMEAGRVDLGAVGDCPRCLARLGPDRILVGTSGWMIYELQLMRKTNGAGKSSK